ncbi:MAG TPA: hypothetical protein VKA91_03490 [Nitrososphaeraceae archaeon]|nr:hypothetical protein [Nitrososphaeraceae archaeon]
MIQNHPQVEKPFGPLQENAAATQVATNKNNTNFGLQQMAFIGQFGTMTPITHTPLAYSYICSRGVTIYYLQHMVTPRATPIAVMNVIESVASFFTTLHLIGKRGWS